MIRLLSLLLLLTTLGPRTATTSPSNILWDKSPDSDVDRFCIAVPNECRGLIDSSGRVIVRFDPPLWSAYDFFEGLMPTAEPGGDLGYVDPDGQ